jgi:hypothetical protein
MKCEMNSETRRQTTIDLVDLGRCIPHLLCLRIARAFPLLPAALASVPFGFVLVRVRVLKCLLFIYNTWCVAELEVFLDELFAYQLEF